MSIIIGNTTIDQWVIKANGKTRKLGGQENQFLRVLTSNLGIIVPRETVEAEISRAKADPVAGRQVDVILCHLRAKLVDIGSTIRIETRARIGWRIPGSERDKTYASTPLQYEAICMCIEIAARSNERVAKIARSAL